MEYISKQQLIAFPIRRDHCDKKNADEHFINGIESVIEYAENLPIIDIVRCHECKHRGTYRLAYHDEYYHMCDNPIAGMTSGVELKNDDVCSYGERRTE